jgi:NAD-dependent DNA ligase
VQLEPFAVLEPVALGGLTYEVLGLGDLSHVQELNLKVSDPVVVQRTADGPPQVC